ncbi:MAG: restriction endonuclease subunit S [Chlorobiaceae bacterium]
MSKWVKGNIGDILSLQRGFDITKKIQTDGLYPVVSSSGVSSYHNEFKVKGPGVVIGRKGTLGSAFYFQSAFWPHDTTLWVKDFKGNDPKFIYYFLKAFPLEMLDSGSANPTLNRNIVHQIDTLKPPLEDQQKIAAVLSALDAKIECNNHINTELEAMAKTLYDYWFVQFNFPDHNGKPYKSSGGKMVYNPTLKRKIPLGWDVCDLNKITSVSNESISPIDTPEKCYRLFSIPVFDITKTYSYEEGKKIGSNKFVVCSKDLLVSKLNPWFNRVVYVMDENDQICSTEFVVWRSSSEEIKNYLYLVAISQQFISYSVQSATGTSNSHKRVNPTVMMRFLIPFNKNIAEKFGEKISVVLKKSILNQQETKVLTQLRDWLLPMLMNGQVTVS